jgi:hypothetical protein
MSPTRLDVSFDLNLVDTASLPGPLRAASQGLADLRTRLLERLSRNSAALEFALIVFWAFTPFALAFLIS